MLRTGIGLQEIWMNLSHADRNSLCAALPERDRTAFIHSIGRKLRLAHWKAELRGGTGWNFVMSLSVEERCRMLQSLDIESLVELLLQIKSSGRPWASIWYFLSGIFFPFSRRLHRLEEFVRQIRFNCIRVGWLRYSLRFEFRKRED